MKTQKSKLRIDPLLQLSSEQIEALGPLAKRIRASWDEANCQAARAREAGNKAVIAALLCGEALLEAKGRLAHGQWLPWLERHCASVAGSMSTAGNWMRLAKANANSQVLGISEASSLTAAYRLVGILPALPEREGGEGGEREITIDALVARLSCFRNVRTKVATWSAEQKRKLAEQLRPLIELYHELLPVAGTLPPGKESI